MRLGTVIGRVTLSRTIPAYEGGRFLLVSPFTRDHYQHRREPPKGLSRDPSPVIYDRLGGGVGDTVGFVEGREAAAPFDEPTPVDAVCVALIDDVFYSPMNL
jgi:microcompartment protein CcmK/EutM